MKKKVLLGLLIALLVLSVACLIIARPISNIKIYSEWIASEKFLREEINIFKEAIVENSVYLIFSFLIISISGVFLIVILKYDALLETEEKRQNRKERRKQKKLLRLNAKIERLKKEGRI